MTASSNDGRRGSQPVESKSTIGRAREGWRTTYDCPAWCTSTEESHRLDDPGRPFHDGHTVRGMLISRIGSQAPVANLQLDGDLSAAELRRLADDAIAVAEWLETNQ